MQEVRRCRLLGKRRGGNSRAEMVESDWRKAVMDAHTVIWWHVITMTVWVRVGQNLKGAYTGSQILAFVTGSLEWYIRCPFYLVRPATQWYLFSDFKKVIPIKEFLSLYNFFALQLSVNRWFTYFGCLGRLAIKEMCTVPSASPPPLLSLLLLRPIAPFRNFRCGL